MSLPVLFDDIALQAYAQAHKLQPFRVKQIFHELFKNNHTRWEQMTTLSKELRDDLAQHFRPVSLEIDQIVDDADTTKIGLKTADGKLIECVLMYHWKDEKYLQDDEPKLNRITLCVSSQIGCPVNCLFCVTGKLGLSRNLTWDEIVSQVLIANTYIKEKFGKKPDGTLYAVRNVVFMGMGEPLLNYDAMKKSVEILLQQDRLWLSKRHVTISTSGIIPGIQRMIDDGLEVKLALSLHAPNQALRERIMPIAKAYPLDTLMRVVDEYVRATDNRLFYEYIMIKGVNDMPELAHELGKLLGRRLAHVNLIPYNENPALDFGESDEKTIRRFQSILDGEYGVTTTVRASMGRDAKGACGQLGYEAIKK